MCSNCPNKCNRLKRGSWREGVSLEFDGVRLPPPSQSQRLSQQLASCLPFDANLYLWGGIFPLFQDMMFLIEQVPPYFAPSCFGLGSQSLGSRTAPSQNSSYPVWIIVTLQPCSVAELLPRSWKRRLAGSWACWSSWLSGSGVAWRWARYCTRERARPSPACPSPQRPQVGDPGTGIPRPLVPLI